MVEMLFNINKGPVLRISTIILGLFFVFKYSWLQVEI